MTKEEIRFEKRKANLIIDCMYEGLFDMVYHEIQSDKYTTIEAVDKYVNEQLSQFDTAVKQVKAFYEARFGDEDDEEDFDEDEEEEDFDEDDS